MDTPTVESQQITEEFQQAPVQTVDLLPTVVRGRGSKPFFNKENARYYQQLAIAKRRKLIQERLNPPTPEQQVQQSEDDYRILRLKRTREQLAKLDALLDAAEDWKAAKAVCEAIARLSVIEGNLAGRPLPGSRRPGREKPERKAAGAAGPLDAETE